MKLTATYQIAASRDKVFSSLIDPDILQRCIDGCEKMVKTSAESYDAHLKIGVAGLKGNYIGKVQLKEQKPPESFTLIIEGKGGPGFVKGTAQIKLAEKGNQTELHCDADAQVGGLIAAIGSRLIEATAKKMMDEFFRKFSEQVQPS
ncbi:MAG: carbon monoxide dehydrogenase subunit G [Verrucomicrobia bacterium]|nr:carbon monoxide dehydrogenase subunit G [Verrucomicrobiota bacterium]